jgi:hypothetical protein
MWFSRSFVDPHAASLELLTYLRHRPALRVGHASLIWLLLATYYQPGLAAQSFNLREAARFALPPGFVPSDGQVTNDTAFVLWSSSGSLLLRFPPNSATLRQLSIPSRVVAAAFDPRDQSVHWFDAQAGRGFAFDADRPQEQWITTDRISVLSGEDAIAAQYDGGFWRVAVVRTTGDSVTLTRWDHGESGWVASSMSLLHPLSLAGLDFGANTISVFDRAWPFSFVVLGLDGRAKGRHEEPTTEFRRWVAGTVVVIGDRFIQMLADVESDSRVVRTFQAGSAIASTRLNGPIGFPAVSPDGRILLAIQNIDGYDAVLYEVTSSPSRFPLEVHQ